VINDRPAAVPAARIRWEIGPIADPREPGADLPAAVGPAAGGDIPVTGVPADRAVIAAALPPLRLARGWHRIRVRLEAADEAVLADNHLDFEVRP
jgi:hypothetical protein